MIRVLIIGRSEASWRERVDTWAPGVVAADGARLPASGLRKFETTPPDAVILVDEDRASRAATLVQAIRERPVGQLIPIVVIAPQAPEDVDVEAQVDAWFGVDIGGDSVRQMLEDVLGETLAPPDDEPSETDSSEPDTATKNDGDHYILEELDEFEEYDQRPRRMTRDAIFAGRGAGSNARASEIDEEVVARKLEEVRHEDYFTILEVRRGASSQVIREAFHRLSDAYEERNLSFELAHEYSDELAEIRDAFEDAWAVLGDPSLREDYLEYTTRK